jgi:hypothetical protein
VNFSSGWRSQPHANKHTAVASPNNAHSFLMRITCAQL